MNELNYLTWMRTVMDWLVELGARRDEILDDMEDNGDWYLARWHEGKAPVAVADLVMGNTFLEAA
jgi:hypothetical protein